MEHIIDSSYSGVRLDKFLRKKYKEIALTEIFKGIRTKIVKVNGKKSKQDYRLIEGDVVKVMFNNFAQKQNVFIELSENEKNILKSGIVYENENIIIFNKNSGMVMHKGSGYDYGISEMFKSFYKTDEFNFINRIDKATSGLVIGAKNLLTTRKLSQEIRDKKIEKKYYVVVEGIVKKNRFTVKNYLKKTDTKMIETTFEDDSKECVSHFEVLKRGKKRTLLRATLETGRTHQLRVQLSELGFSIVGDSRYGKYDEQMLLFSYFCKIKSYGIKIEMPIPKIFKMALI